jgi:hypothetical protein
VTVIVCIPAVTVAVKSDPMTVNIDVKVETGGVIVMVRPSRVVSDTVTASVTVTTEVVPITVVVKTITVMVGVE